MQCRPEKPNFASPLPACARAQPVELRGKALLPGAVPMTNERMEPCSKVGRWLMAGYILGECIQVI